MQIAARTGAGYDQGELRSVAEKDADWGAGRFHSDRLSLSRLQARHPILGTGILPVLEVAEQTWFGRRRPQRPTCPAQDDTVIYCTAIIPVQ